jgi:hypothetical protein
MPQSHFSHAQETIRAAAESRQDAQISYVVRGPRGKQNGNAKSHHRVTRVDGQDRRCVVP